MAPKRAMSTRRTTSTPKIAQQNTTKVAKQPTSKSTVKSKAIPTGTKRKADDDVIDDTPSSVKKFKVERRDCDICVEDKPATNASYPIVSSCSHDRTVCKVCYVKHITTTIESDLRNGWEGLNCPLCSEDISEVEARVIMTKRAAKALDDQIAKVLDKDHPRWLWCPNTDCGEGQVHEDRGTLSVKCKACKTSICFTHQRKWHQGMTCEEWDAAANQDEAAKRDADELKRATKPCPFCHVRISKLGGCNHMSCGNCRKQFFWSDVPFDGEEAGDGREVLDGRVVQAPPPPQQRVNIDRAIQAANAQIDDQNAPVQPMNERAANFFGNVIGRAAVFLHRATGRPPTLPQANDNQPLVAPQIAPIRREVEDNLVRDRAMRQDLREAFEELDMRMRQPRQRETVERPGRLNNLLTTTPQERRQVNPATARARPANVPGPSIIVESSDTSDDDELFNPAATVPPGRRPIAQRFMSAVNIGRQNNGEVAMPESPPDAITDIIRGRLETHRIRTRQAPLPELQLTRQHSTRQPELRTIPRDNTRPSRRLSLVTETGAPVDTAETPHPIDVQFRRAHTRPEGPHLYPQNDVQSFHIAPADEDSDTVVLQTPARRSTKNVRRANRNPRAGRQGSGRSDRSRRSVGGHSRRRNAIPDIPSSVIARHRVVVDLTGDGEPVEAVESWNENLIDIDNE